MITCCYGKHVFLCNRTLYAFKYIRSIEGYMIRDEVFVRSIIIQLLDKKCITEKNATLFINKMYYTSF